MALLSVTGQSRAECVPSVKFRCNLFSLIKARHCQSSLTCAHNTQLHPGLHESLPRKQALQLGRKNQKTAQNYTQAYMTSLPSSSSLYLGSKNQKTALNYTQPYMTSLPMRRALKMGKFSGKVPEKQRPGHITSMPINRSLRIGMFSRKVPEKQRPNHIKPTDHLKRGKNPEKSLKL